MSARRGGVSNGASKGASRRRPALLVAVSVALLLAAGCASLPDDGPVQASGTQSPSSAAAPFDFNPPGPAPGARPAEIVSGFLRALQATPVTTRVAAEYLGRDAAAGWRPDRRTLVYGTPRVRQHGARVLVDLDSTFELDRHGRWEARRRGSERPTARLAFDMVREDGEWRITDPPDAMIVPRSHFETRYREYSLFFFDLSASVLVPEPVYLPVGVQAPTLLVSALLAGPRRGDGAVERTFLPQGTKLEVSVPVDGGGVAEVPLTGAVLDLSGDQRQLVTAQLAWTLGQVPGVEAFRMSVDGTPVQVPGTGSVIDVGTWQEYSPAIASASTDLFGVRGDAVVQVVGDSPLEAAELGQAVNGPPRSLGVNMTGQRFAVVAADGRTVVVLSRAGADVRPRTAYVGSDVLRPMWDRTDRLWLVERTAVGSRVLVGSASGVRPITAPGLESETVLAAALSRDGTRLVAAVEGRRPGSTAGARLVLLRVVRGLAEVPQRLTPARPVTTAEPLIRVLDVGWRDPTTVAALTRPSRTTSQVLLAAVDGSTASVGLQVPIDVLFARGVSLAASPGGPTALMVATVDQQLQELDPVGRWLPGDGSTGLRIPTYVG